MEPLTLISGASPEKALWLWVSIMFQLSDTVILKEEVALSLKIHTSFPDTADMEEPLLHEAQEPVCVADEAGSVPERHIVFAIKKALEFLMAQGLPGFQYRHVHIKLSVLSGDCEEQGSSPPGIQISKLMEITSSCASAHFTFF